MDVGCHRARLCEDHQRNSWRCTISLTSIVQLMHGLDPLPLVVAPRTLPAAARGFVPLPRKVAVPFCNAARTVSVDRLTPPLFRFGRPTTYAHRTISDLLIQTGRCSRASKLTDLQGNHLPRAISRLYCPMGTFTLSRLLKTLPHSICQDLEHA
jgi:hypothetical protein